jgi:hypothetical protein
VDRPRGSGVASGQALALVLLALAGVLLGGCGSSRPLQPSASTTAASLNRQADTLLAKYGLHPSGSARSVPVTFGKAGSLPFVLYATASKSTGLDLSGYAGKRVWLLMVPFKERSQVSEANVRAYFVVDHDTVVGAYMVLDGYAPGVESLAERSDFAPPSLSPEHPVFEAVKSIEIVGPWTGTDWRRSVVLSDPAEVEKTLSLLAASVGQRGTRYGVRGDEEYMLLINYRDGVVVRASLTTKRRSGATFLTFDPGAFFVWHYLPPAQLKAHVKSVLGVK